MARLACRGEAAAQVRADSPSRTSGRSRQPRLVALHSRHCSAILWSPCLMPAWITIMHSLLMRSRVMHSSPTQPHRVAAVDVNHGHRYNEYGAAFDHSTVMQATCSCGLLRTHMFELSAASADQISGHNAQGQRCGHGRSASGAGEGAAAAVGQRIQAALAQRAASWRCLQLPRLLKASFRCRQAPSDAALQSLAPPPPSRLPYLRAYTPGLLSPSEPHGGCSTGCSLSIMMRTHLQGFPK